MSTRELHLIGLTRTEYLVLLGRARSKDELTRKRAKELLANILWMLRGK